MDTRLRNSLRTMKGALKVDKQAPFFAEHFISAGPKGSIAVGREEFLRMSQGIIMFIAHEAEEQAMTPNAALPLVATNGYCSFCVYKVVSSQQGELAWWRV